MQFALTNEQTLIDDTIERLLAEQTGSGDAGRLWQLLAELGVLGAALPEDVGGTGGGPTELMILARRLGRHLAPSHFLATTVIGAHVLQRVALGGATGAQFAQSCLQPVASGEQTLALAAFEQPTRYALDALQSTARKLDGGWLLNGSKHYVLDGATADTLIVAACPVPGDMPALFAVARDTAGVQVYAYEGFDRSALATISLRDVRVGDAQCLANADQHPVTGVCVLKEALALAAFAASAEVLGACEMAFEKTIDYLRVREQFGRPLSSFQALQHRASDLHAEMEMLRSLVLGAAQRLGAGIDDQSAADAHAAMVMAAQVGDHVGREAIQMHGAVGMTRDLGVGRYLMRINTLSRLFGDADDYRLRYLNYLEETNQ